MIQFRNTVLTAVFLFIGGQFTTLQAQSVFRLINSEGGVQQFVIPNSGLPVRQFWKKYQDGNTSKDCDKSNETDQGKSDFSPEVFKEKLPGLFQNAVRQRDEIKKEIKDNTQLTDVQKTAATNLIDGTFGAVNIDSDISPADFKQSVDEMFSDMSASGMQLVVDTYGDKLRGIAAESVRIVELNKRLGDNPGDSDGILLIQIQKISPSGSLSIYFPVTMLPSFVGEFTITDNDSVHVRSIDESIWSEVYLLDGYPQGNVITQSRKQGFTVSGLLAQPKDGLKFKDENDRITFKYVFNLQQSNIPDGDLIGKIVRKLPATNSSPASAHILYFPYFQIPRNYWSSTPSKEKKWLDNQLILGGDLIAVDPPQNEPLLSGLYRNNRLTKLGLMKQQFLDELKKKQDAANAAAKQQVAASVKPRILSGSLPKVNLQNAGKGIAGGFKNLRLKVPKFKLPF